MKINSINGNQKFKGIRISKNMPKLIVDAIKENPVINRAGKNYSLWFNHGKNYTMLNITTPNIDSPLRLLFTPPHSIKRKSLYMGQKTSEVLDKLDNIEYTPYFFEKLVGFPRTFKQKLTAFIEAWKIAFMPNNKTVAQETKIFKIFKKYENLNMPQ